MVAKIKQSLWILLPIIFILMVFSTVRSLNQPDHNTAIDPGWIINDFEDSPSELELSGKEVVKVGVYVLRILNFDSATGTYQIELFLNFECETIPCDPSNFEIPNATSTPEITDETDPSDTGSYYYYRVRTNLQTTIDVSQFPFDVQKLRIEFEDQSKPNHQYIFVPDPIISGIDPQVVIAGWSAEPRITGYEEAHYYNVYDESYSKAVFELLAYNPWWESFLRTILPVIVITFAGIISFFMRYDRAGDRLGVVTSSLVSAVLFSLSFPKGATYMSAYMVANYLILVSALAVTVRLMSLGNENKLDEAKKLHDLTDNIYPVMWLIVQVMFVVYPMVGFSN